MNPGRLLLALGGIVAIFVGIRGSQSQVLAAITGKSSPAKSSSSSSSSRAVPAGGGGSFHLVGPTSSAPGAPTVLTA